MKKPAQKRIITLGLLLLAAVIAAWVFIPSNKARRAAERTRRDLRAQGFKLDLIEFDFTNTAEQRDRARVILQAGRVSVGLLPMRDLDLARPTATNAAIVLHDQPTFLSNFSTDGWSTLTEMLDERRSLLDQACAAACAGELRFEPATGSGGELIVLYVPELRALASALAARMVLELHRSNHLAAFSNLLAVTRLATAWRVEPVEQAHSMRLLLSVNAERALWEALHSPGWTDAELTRLQKEWQAPDFLSGLPEASACSRAASLAQQQREARQPLPPPVPLRQILLEMFSSPAAALNNVQARVTTSRYHNYGIFEEERDTMLYYRDRELDLRNAIAANTWSQMRVLPGVTNSGPLGPSGRQFGIHTAPRSIAWRQTYGLPRRAAEAETLRRLAITALALERYHLTRGTYPDSLAALSPAFIGALALTIDFMDGQSFRYELQSATNFLLYSVGPDCVDDGGKMMRLDPQTGSYGINFTGSSFRREGPDLLWPRAATSEERRTDLATRSRTYWPSSNVQNMLFPARYNTNNDPHERR